MDSPKLTVGDLRRALADLPDDAPVYINTRSLDSYGPLTEIESGIVYRIDPYTVKCPETRREYTYTNVWEFRADDETEPLNPDYEDRAVRAINLEA